MKKYIIWCRWGPLAGPLPERAERDKKWNVVSSIRGKDDCLWGYDTEEEAENKAFLFEENWQPGMMMTKVTGVELPDYPGGRP